jgi:GTP-binding protein EngB required for normal cell division
VSGKVFDRIDALGRFVEASRGFVPEPELAPATELIARGGERLKLSRSHTVVALAGSTGTGKSSIFNALAGVSLSQTGIRRPTTGEAHACVWGTETADPLLDWLGVRKRYTREAAELDGLVLLDLPDFDSVESAHRAEADRLLAVVDLIVWVLHPQKYADKVVHRSYLQQFHEHRDITIVVLNQVDLLSKEDMDECLTDLRSLLRADGLGDVPVLTASTVAAPGLDALNLMLGKEVAARRAAVNRLSADVATVVGRLEPLAGPPAPKLGKDTKRALNDALARAAGVPVVTAAVENAYVHRARKLTGWPPLRWLRRFRPDPLARLHLGSNAPDAGLPATSIGPAAPATQAAVALALRSTAEQTARDLPGPWQEAVLTATRSRMDDLPDALDRAVASTDLGLSRPRFWWQVVSFLHWLAFAVALLGLVVLAARYVMFALALPEIPLPQTGRIPLPTAMLGGGLLAGLLIAILVRPIVRLSARSLRRRADTRLRAAVAIPASELVLAPAERVLTSYAQARDALKQAGR